MKRFTKIMAIIMATALIMGIAAISASAANYTPQAGGTTSFNKYLIVSGLRRKLRKEGSQHQF